MENYSLNLDPGFALPGQYAVALFAAQLDDQSARLKRAVTGLAVEQLEWQTRPGMNTVGMLLAHIAVAETFWMKSAPEELAEKSQWDEIILKTIGIRGDDDGLPLPADGIHPATLRGKTLDEYLRMLDKSRAATIERLKSWRDSDLDTSHQLEGGRFTCAWTVYHVLEHLVGHAGQIRQLKHMMIDAGVLQPTAPDPE